MNVIIFIVALSILVLVHEFGHYFAAKRTKVKVEEFGLGLPPRITGKKIGETIFSLNWLPIGGFCKLYGEDGGGEGNRAFNNKNPWQKMLIVLGGVLMNLFLAVVIFTIVYAILGVPSETDRVKVVGVAPESPAAIAGLEEEDWIIKVGEEVIESPDELTNEVEKYKGESVELLVESGGHEKTVTVEVRENPPEGEGGMGVAISNTEMVKVPWYQFYKGIVAGFEEAYFWGKIIVGGVASMVGGLLSGNVPKDVSGPIGMFEATSTIKESQGMLAVVHFFGVVSVNLAVVNVLPFPALDGGRIIFVLYELISGRKANQRVESIINSIGMVILLGLIVLITAGDIARLINN
ncbi:MAG: M50 family metallopeptidase [Patescibacteria group bacterium]|jgi:regulator of sigma E protease